MTQKKHTETRTKAVIITTAHRGVFFGDIDPDHEERTTIAVSNVRNAIYWGTTRGFIELAETGPTAKSKVGATGKRTVLHDVTSVTECTEAAAAVWRAFP